MGKIVTKKYIIFEQYVSGLRCTQEFSQIVVVVEKQEETNPQAQSIDCFAMKYKPVALKVCIRHSFK